MRQCNGQNPFELVRAQRKKRIKQRKINKQKRKKNQAIKYRIPKEDGRALGKWLDTDGGRDLRIGRATLVQEQKVMEDDARYHLRSL